MPKVREYVKGNLEAGKYALSPAGGNGEHGR